MLKNINKIQFQTSFHIFILQVICRRDQLFLFDINSILILIDVYIIFLSFEFMRSYHFNMNNIIVQTIINYVCKHPLRQM